MTYLVNTSGDVLVALSTNGGTSFTKVADIQTKFGDQPSIAVGSNSVWVSYTASPGKQIQAFGARVTGLGGFGSFSAPENVPSPGNGDYGDTAVGPVGQVMVTYQNAVNGQGGADIYTAVDPDGLGPAGFGKPTLVAHSHVGGFDFIAAQPNRSIDAEANLAWDRSGGAHNGRVYLVWTQETPNESDNTDIMFQHSDDKGATWSPAVRVNDDRTTTANTTPRSPSIRRAARLLCRGTTPGMISEPAGAETRTAFRTTISRSGRRIPRTAGLRSRGTSA